MVEAMLRFAESNSSQRPRELSFPDQTDLVGGRGFSGEKEGHARIDGRKDVKIGMALDGK